MRQNGFASNYQETKFQTVVSFKSDYPEVHLDSYVQSNG